MAIREALQKKQSIAAIIAIVFILAMCAIIVRNVTNTEGGFANSAYYSDDDGKSFFVDDALKIPPFDHGGKWAVKAHVYRCGSEKSVHYLERYTEKGRAAAQESLRRSGGKEVSLPESLVPTGVEYKRPGEATWGPNPPGPKSCPDGSPPQWETP